MCELENVKKLKNNFIKIHMHLLTVVAEDGGLSPLSDRTEVEISIVDVNDNAPRFSNGPVYSGTVHENAPAGTSVTQVSAYDDDAGENGKVRYRCGHYTFFMAVFKAEINKFRGKITKFQRGVWANKR